MQSLLFHFVVLAVTRSIVGLSLFLFSERSRYEKKRRISATCGTSIHRFELLFHMLTVAVSHFKEKRFVFVETHCMT